MKFKKSFTPKQLIQFQGDAKNTWRSMKEVIGKGWTIQPLLPSKIIINKIEIMEDKRIANQINNCFIDIGPELAKEIPRPARSFKNYVTKSNSTMPTGSISVNELKNGFFSIKAYKYLRHNEINFNVIRSCFGELCQPLQYLFNVSFEKNIFPNHLKLAKVTPVFKAGNNTELMNYRPISVLPCFSKILNRCNYTTCSRNTQQFRAKYL